MAFRKRKTKRAPRRRRRRTRFSKNVTVNKGISPLASRYSTKMKYSSVVTITPGALQTIAAWSYNLNGLFDPDQTGTGHQPYGFDQLAQLYTRYIVKKCSWVVTFRQNGASGIAGVMPQNGPNSPVGNNADYLSEVPRCFHRNMSNVNPTMIKGSINMWNLNGQTRAHYMADDRFQAQVGANPTEVMYLWAMLSSTTATGYITDVALVYDVDFFDPVLLTQS